MTSWQRINHVQGDRIFLSGDVTYADAVSLPALLAKAQAEGRPVREVVLRTSNGGALIAGEWLQGIIRTSGLNTIVSGNCISSCSIMQSGGVERYLAGDLPLIDSVQIHAASSGGKVIYTPSPRMTQIYSGNYGGGMDAGLLHKAMYEVVKPNGLLVLRVPARGTGPSVTFDPDGSGSKLESFPGQDIYSNRIITAYGYRDPGDTLNVTANVTGDINPGYLRTGRQLQAFVDDDFARWNTDWRSTYINVAQSIYTASSRGPQGIGALSVQGCLSDPDIQDLLLSKLRLADLDVSTLDNAKASDGSGFTGDVRALDVGGYLDATYARGYLSAAVRYTDLRHDTRRSIGGIDGLQQPLRAKYSNDAISARVEHAFSFTTGKGLVIQPLLPVVDYARTSATRFNEGQGAGALVGRSGSLESIRVGAGLQLFKTFEGNNGERITPRARVVWQKELGDSQARYSTGFAAAPDLVFGASSQAVGEQVLAWNLGVTSRASERLSIMADYVGERRDGQIQNGVMLGLGYRF